jgi:hypothetical protein
MHLGHRNPAHNYSMSEQQILDTVKEEKDLGVIIDCELKLQSNCESQVNKANRLVGLIRRTFCNIDTTTFNLLYKSLVRPHLEYCHVVSFPQYRYQVNLLKGVQRRATKLVPACKHLEYEDRLKLLKLPSLVYRRNRGDMIEVYKYIHGLNKTSSPLYMDAPGRMTRGHSLRLSRKHCNLDVRKKFFCERVIANWNGLPSNIVEAPSLNSFKNQLDRHWTHMHYSL